MNKHLLVLLTLLCVVAPPLRAAADPLVDNFITPPDAARPGVYWYFMDGNLNGKEMTADLESMKAAGLGNLVFLEVDVGVPRGPVKFMSEPWQDLFAQAVHDAERLGIDISLGTGPGWCGSGGPWVKPEQSMQHLVFSTVEVKGPTLYNKVLPVPEQRKTPWHTMGNPFYQDVAVFAFPSRQPIIPDINEKALFSRDPYTSMEGVKTYLPTAANYTEPARTSLVEPKDIVELTAQLKADGTLSWQVPTGDWTIIRMGRRTTGASTRPAPDPGVGLECDKFDAQALNEHLDRYVGTLLKKIGPRAPAHGLTTLHIDSWEMGAQNWTPTFLAEFQKRRGYDARPWLPVYTGRAIQSLEQSDRFLWDIRLTAQELVLENHAEAVKTWGKNKGLQLSIEPYDMNPTADLDLGAVADVPMAEFWSAGYGFNSAFSCIESTSIAHIMGRPIVSAEAFTAGGEHWKQYPTSMKNQGDWALAMGINRFVYHTFAHQTLGADNKPGMTMGPYGVHWDRSQTWWPMVQDYHAYITRCSALLREGVTVSDVLYLTPEGAPQIFVPPSSALEGTGPLVDKKGYGFDGCSPNILMARAEVQNGLITFPGGTSYRLMVLPKVDTMTPQLLKKIGQLINAGATVVGFPPRKSPSLVGFPACDAEVQALAEKIWGGLEVPAVITPRKLGKGSVYWGTPLIAAAKELYPAYTQTASVLSGLGVSEDFTATGPVRYGHRRTAERDIYFIANRSGNSVQAECRFRVGQGQPELWNPVTGERRLLTQYTMEKGVTTIPLEFAAHQSFFVVFTTQPTTAKSTTTVATGAKNVPVVDPVQTLTGAWTVAFDPKWGGPEQVTFETLQDWTQRAESGIKYYSGIATYRKTFAFNPVKGKQAFLDLGVVNDMARVRLNGKDLGVIWCAPWRVEITSVVKPGDNQVEIEVVNRWPNRLIGDQQEADANVRDVQWTEGFLDGKAQKTGRYTFTTFNPYKKDSKLFPSGLIGPVQVMEAK
jgi:hypothetical protein